MFVFDDALVERITKETGLSEAQIRHGAKKLIAAGLVQDLGRSLRPLQQRFLPLVRLD